MEKLVSVIIPARNEELFIGRCLESILSQDFPKENLEILVVDGASEDKTKEIVKKFNVRLLDNPQKFTSFGLNIGIRQARGEIIVRIDAHASYEKDYIAKCVRYLEEYKADNVGGVIKTLPAKDTAQAKAIALVLSSCFGVASSFRLGSDKPKETDTVFGGCYRKAVFEKIGYFNEKLKRSQDLEFNLRLKKAGGKILLFPDIVVRYYPQPTLGKFFKHNFQDGIWALGFKLRHYLPLIFILTLPLSLWPYLMLLLFFSFKIAGREKDFRLLFLLPPAFICRHFGYGLGSLWSLVKLIK